MWYDVISYSSWLTSLLPLIYVMARRGLKLNTLLGYVVLVKALSFSVDGVCLILTRYNIPNSALINLYVALEFLIILKIYNCFFKSKKWRWTLYSMSAGLLFYVMYLLVFQRDFSSFSNQLNTVSAICVTAFSVIAFNKLIEDSAQRDVKSNYFFWINTAFMVYYLCNLALFLFKAYILGTEANYDTSRIWGLHNFFHVCANVMILTGFVVWRKQSSSNTSLSGS